MKRIYQHTRLKVWFARWAKTPWAVFNSLRVVVHILCVNITAFKDTLLHQLGIDKQTSYSKKTQLAFDLKFALFEGSLGFTLFNRAILNSKNTDEAASTWMLTP